MPPAGDEHSIEIRWSGSDELLLKALIAHEELGQPFWCEVVLLCRKPDIAFDSVVGETMGITYTDQRDNTKSHFHGYVVSFVQSDADNQIGITAEELFGYRATIAPALWLLSRSQDCKIFQKKKLPDIVKEVCRERGCTDIRDSMSATYEEFEYTVQYRESDFNFVSRLMQREGIYYYFEHEENKHTLVLVDSSSGHPTSGAPELPFRGKDDTFTEEEEPILEWRIRKQVKPVEFQTDDYDFEKPTNDLFAKNKIAKKHGYAKGVVYDYPGRYLKTAQGNTYAKINAERLQATHEVFTGKTICQKVRAGQVFKLKEHNRPEQNREYLVIASRVTVNPETLGRSAAEQRGTNVYDCEFTAIDLQVPFRPDRTAAQPVVHGPQTAVVVGPQNEEIHTDKYGRIKVQFHWDRVGQKDENSSCFIRVVSTWAGKKWGFIQIPRIGQEVMVEFLEGDPDRPIVTGVVYNADLMPPYDLPANATQSGLKTQSTKKGTAENFNELRFEDKKGEEHIYFHAEKDFKRIVENDDVLKVGFEKKEPGSQTIDIYKDRTVTIAKGNDTLKVEEGELLIDVKKKITIKCGKSVLVMKDDGTITVDGKDMKHTMSNNFDVKATSNVKLAGTAGFAAKGLKAEVVADTKLDLKGAIVDLNGSGMAKVKGGMVMIN
jgi:type VI secretion system secreted protein VgrG